MLDEHQFHDSRATALEDPYSYTLASGRERVQSRREDHPPVNLFRYRVVKRCIDILLVAAAGPIVLPIVLLVAVLVKLSSPGPVFYAHRRIRRNGGFFSMWKFRTMCVNSAEVLEQHLAAHPEARSEWNRTHKLRHDPRVTRIGALLRRYSIDELPQVWNILIGQMSLVGPRPIVAAEVEKYGDLFSYYCLVKPGLTGLWQVSGRSTLSYPERVAIDRRYVEQWSLMGDSIILLKTFRSVVNQDGAY